MFEQITAFLPGLKEKPHGEWIIDKENEGISGRSIQLPFVDYTDIVHDFEDAVYRFIDNHEEMKLTSYSVILEKANVQWGSIQ